MSDQMEVELDVGGGARPRRTPDSVSLKGLGVSDFRT